jgi:hypothetical protein
LTRVIGVCLHRYKGIGDERRKTDRKTKVIRRPQRLTGFPGVYVFGDRSVLTGGLMPLIGLVIIIAACLVLSAIFVEPGPASGEPDRLERGYCGWQGFLIWFAVLVLLPLLGYLIRYIYFTLF